MKRIGRAQRIGKERDQDGVEHCLNVDSEEWTATLSRVLVENELEQMLEHENVKCLASGRVGSVQRFYFFAEQVRCHPLS